MSLESKQAVVSAWSEIFEEAGKQANAGNESEAKILLEFCKAITTKMRDLKST